MSESFKRKVQEQQITSFSSSPEIINVKPVIDGPLPCNGYPEYRKLPVNQAFYLGANNAGSHVFSNDCQVKQQNDIPQILKDGNTSLSLAPYFFLMYLHRL